MSHISNLNCSLEALALEILRHVRRRVQAAAGVHALYVRADKHSLLGMYHDYARRARSSYTLVTTGT